MEANPSFRIRSISFALGILIVTAQAVGLYALVATYPAPRDEIESASPPTLILLKPLARDNASSRTVPNGNTFSPAVPSRLITLPPVDISLSTAPAPNADAATLGVLLSCESLDGRKMAPSERERCRTTRDELLRQALSIGPTEEQRALTRRYAEEKVAQQYGAPPARPGARSQPERGVTNISELPAGLPNRTAALEGMIHPTAPHHQLFIP